MKEHKKESFSGFLELYDIPDNTEFIVVWEQDRKICSGKFKCKGKKVFIYNVADEKFFESGKIYQYGWAQKDETNVRVFTY